MTGGPTPARLRRDALAVLRRWAPPDAGQAELRQVFVAHLERHRGGLSRHCLPDHVPPAPW